VAELTADELSFWQGNPAQKVASYKGNRISFLSGGEEVFYIENGVIYCVGGMTIRAGANFYVESDNLIIDKSGLTVVGGTIRSNLYSNDGYPVLTNRDIVISSLEPAPVNGKVWIKPIGSTATQYQYESYDQSSFFAGERVLFLTGQAAQVDPNVTYNYRLILPVYSNSPGNETLDIEITAEDGYGNEITFPTQTLDPHMNTILNIPLTLSGQDAVWIATGSFIAVTITPDEDKQSIWQDFGINMGQVTLAAGTLGTGTAGWKDCEIKVYQE
jgi:hypothetical protein